MREEIGVEVEVVRPLWFVENFFTFAGKRYHEISVYFLMRLPTQCEYLVQTGAFQGEEQEGNAVDVSVVSKESAGAR